MPVLMCDGILKRKESKPVAYTYRPKYPPACIKLDTPHDVYKVGIKL